MGEVEHVLSEIHAQHGDGLETWDLRPLEKLVKKIKSPVGEFEARATLAAYQCEAGRRNDGLATYMAAWKKRPKDETAILSSGFEIVERACSYGDELSSKEKAFALNVANDLLALVEYQQSQPCTACEGEQEGEEVAKVADGAGSDGSCGCSDGGDGDGLAPYALYQVARAQVLNGDRDDAIATMQAVLEQQPENETYLGYVEWLSSEEGS